VRANICLAWIFALSGAGLAACGGGGDDGDPQDGASDATVELGTGTTAFEPLAEDSELVLVAGPQGGHHFIVHARMSGLLPGDPTQPGLLENPATRFTVRDEAGDRLDVNMAPYRLGYEPDGDAYVLTSGHIVQVVEEAVASLYAGARTHIAVEVTDSDGESASDDRWVIPIEAPSAR
jgi:hypothetical protein